MKETIVKCSRCKAQNTEDYHYCINCGNPLPVSHKAYINEILKRMPSPKLIEKIKAKQTGGNYPTC